MNQLERKHRKTAEKIIKEFLKPHQKFENNVSKSKIHITIKFPPEIPSQQNTFDCGVFMLVFAKYICLGKQFYFTCKDMPYFREEIKEEIIRNQINFHTDNDGQNRILSHPLSICSFINPSRRNLCFSNVVVSLLLNIPLLRSRLMNDENFNEENQLLTEFKRLAKLPKFTKSSTIKIRYLTKRKCIQAGQLLQNYSNNKQHDAGEFLMSVIEHLFEDSICYQDFDEQMFGGLYQNILNCSCGLITEKEITKMI